MTTKNLMRSYREAGQRRSCQRIVAKMKRQERRQARKALDEFVRDPEDSRSAVDWSNTKLWWGYDRHQTNWNIWRRWIAKQFGLSWDEVYSRALKKFGREIVKDNLLPNVARSTDALAYRADYLIDEDGVFIENDLRQYSWSYETPRPNAHARFTEWLDHRLVVKIRGRGLRWLVPTGWRWNDRGYFGRRLATPVQEVIGWRLGERLTEEEYNFLIDQRGDDRRGILRKGAVVYAKLAGRQPKRFALDRRSRLAAAA